MDTRARSDEDEPNLLATLGSQTISRRDLLKAGGALVIGFSLFGTRDLIAPAAGQAEPWVPPGELDSWLAVAEDGSVTLFTGRVDVGTGMETAMAQIAAEELQVAFERVRVLQGDTAFTVDQGSTNGSTSLAIASPQVRQAAAEARAALVEMAGEHLAAPADALGVHDGVVAVDGDPARRVSYAELVGGKRLNRQITGTATPRRPDDYTVVGQPIPRLDIPAKVTGRAEYVHDVRLPGMLYARVVKPPALGSTLVNVDEASVRDVPGLVRIVVRGNFVGVVAEREEQAIRAARQLTVTWTDWTGLRKVKDLYRGLLAAPSIERVLTDNDAVEPALLAAARTVEATYYYPFQTHGSIGPSCAVADVRDGAATVWSGTRGPHGMRRILARMLDLPLDQVRVIWATPSGGYGDNGANDATLDAAVLSQAVGRPVRLQWMREDEHRWANTGPAMIFDLRGGLDRGGRLTALDYQAHTPSHFYDDLLAERLLSQDIAAPDGPPPRSSPWGGELRTAYALEGCLREVVHQIQYSPLRSHTLRAPALLATTFAVESFMDELAAAAGEDPVAFRLRLLEDARTSAVLRAAAAEAGWEPRPSPQQPLADTRLVSGRGVALVRKSAGSLSTLVAMVAEVTVDRETGEIRVTRAVVAHDCGLIVNPDGLINQIEGNVIQTTSRALKEEMAYDDANVTSVDWASYPILTFTEVPRVETVLIDHPELPPSGAGEPASCPVPASIANAVFDATGVRLREVPFTADRVRAALRATAG